MKSNRTLIKNAAIVNEGRLFAGSVVIAGDRIEGVFDADKELTGGEFGNVVDADGMLLLPGVIDTHVHFRDGGLHDNPAGTFYSESRAARAGGVTSVIDMPNTTPQTTTLDALRRKEEMAAADSAVNYGFMLGATNDNIDQLLAVDPERYAAIKLFLGSSTGNMLVNDSEMLDRLFRESRKLIVAHCEEERVVQSNLVNYKHEYQGTEGETAALHPKIRNSEACFLSTYHAVELARRHGTRLHVAHLSTATELSLLSNFDLNDKHITAEVTPNHLYFDDRDYAVYGNLIKCNPAIKSNDDRLALWAALEDGLIDTIASDHAPHTFDAKMRPYFDAPSGIPSVQHTLTMMLEAEFCMWESWRGCSSQSLVNGGRVTGQLAMIVNKMCHAPAVIFGIKDRGFIRKGFKADLVLVRPGVEQAVSSESLLYKCGWSPLEGHVFHTAVERVWVNGDDSAQPHAEQLEFTR